MTEATQTLSTVTEEERAARRALRFAPPQDNLLLRLALPLTRPLPDFIIIGAQKAGTTSLYAYLCQHPQVMRAARKELHFFTDRYNLGLSWYRRQFPHRIKMIRRCSRLGRRVITGEASPSYLFHPHAARRIARIMPDVRLIVILRNPVARAYSHYRHNLKHNAERRPFEKAIKREPRHVNHLIERQKHDEHFQSKKLRHHSYLARGVYVDQIRAFHEHFDRSQLLVLSSDDLFSDPQKVYSQTLDFLGLNDREIKDDTPRNVGSYDRREIPMKQELEEYFRPHNRRLYEYLGRDFGWPA